MEQTFIDSREIVIQFKPRVAVDVEPELQGFACSAVKTVWLDGVKDMEKVLTMTDIYDAPIKMQQVLGDALVAIQSKYEQGRKEGLERIADLEKQLTDARQGAAQLEIQLTDEREAVARTQAAIDALSAEVAALSASEAQAQQQLLAAQAAAAAAESRANDLESQLAGNDARIAALEASLAANNSAPAASASA